MDKQKGKIFIGFITYGKSTAKYLPYFLPSLKAQTYKNFKITAVDNSETGDSENSIYIKNNFPEIDLSIAGENIGFAKAFNKMIEHSVNDGAQYFLALNPDVILKDDTVEKLVVAMDNNNELGSATAKILKWNFTEQKKTSIIDSCGIKLVSGLRFFDIGQGELDKGQYDNIEILGPSGAVAIYRVKALQAIKENGQFFDERMFMYKEDCDLAYRLFLAGYKSICVGDVITYHDRTASGAGESSFSWIKARKNKNDFIKINSFRNQQLIFKKFWKLQNWRSKLAIIYFEIKVLTYMFIFERKLFNYIKK